MMILVGHGIASAECGFAINYHPLALRGWYKAQRYSSFDTLSVSVSLFNDKVLTDSGYWSFNFGGGQIVWGAFEALISNNVATADSVSILAKVVKLSPAATTENLNLDALFFDDNSGVENTKSILPLSIMPNPSSNAIVFSGLPQNITSYQLTAMNAIGQSFELKENTVFETIDISFLPSGFYQLMLSSETKTWVGKFVKE